MPAAVPDGQRLDVPVLTRVTRMERDYLHARAVRDGTTVAALTREALRRTGLLPTALR